MKLLKKELTEEQQKWCEHKIRLWASTSKNLTRPEYTTSIVAILLKYEIDTRRRKDVLNRLAGRYAKLRRIDEWEQINAYTSLVPAKLPTQLYTLKEVT